MRYFDTLDHYSILWSKEGGAKKRTPYLQVSGTPCHYQPAPSQNMQPQVKADTEQEYGKIFLTTGTTWEDIKVGHLIKVTGKSGVSPWLEVKGKKNLCNLGRVFRIDVLEDIKGDLP